MWNKFDSLSQGQPFPLIVIVIWNHNLIHIGRMRRDLLWEDVLSLKKKHMENRYLIFLFYITARAGMPE